MRECKLGEAVSERAQMKLRLTFTSATRLLSTSDGSTTRRIARLRLSPSSIGRRKWKFSGRVEMLKM